MALNYERIKEAAQGYEAQMTKFLRDIVRAPGESSGEKAHADRIAQEMRALDFDKVEIDPMGNVLGYMGHGTTLIAFDGHIDTVGIGNRANWEWDVRSAGRCRLGGLRRAHYEGSRTALGQVHRARHGDGAGGGL